MDNIIRFHLQLNLDGKNVAVEASQNVLELQRNLKAAQGEAAGFANSFMVVNQKIELARNAFTGIADGFNALTAESRSFSSAMTAANTMAGKSGADFDKLKDSVAELAKTVPVARDQLANGLYQVVSNGVPEDNWITFLEKSAKSSVGGMADLQEVVKVTSTMIKNYGLSWEQAGDIQDKIQLTAKNGVTSFEQLAQALPRVASNASSLGVSIDELMATFATLTGVSGNTAEVSTQLAAVFTALIKPSTEAQKTAELLGVKFDAASVKAAGGLQNFLRQLDQAVQSYSAKSGVLSQEIYGKLFGSAESLRAITPLVGQLSEKFTDNISAMRDSAGTMETAFNDMGKTGASKLQLLQNALAGIGDTITSAIGPALPLLNITAQVGMSITAISSMVAAFSRLNLVTKTASALGAVWRTVTYGIASSSGVAATGLLSFATAANIAKIAWRGLIASTVIGAVFAGIGIAIEKVIGLLGGSSDAMDKASQSAENASSAINGATETLEDHKNQALAPVAAKYDELREKWLQLKTDHEKNEFILNNASAFAQLGVGINSVSQAESFFVKNSANVVRAMDLRAEAAANAAMAADAMTRALNYEAQASGLIQTGRDKYFDEHKTGKSAHDLSLRALIDNGVYDDQIAQEDWHIRSAQARARGARIRATRYNRQSARLQQEANSTLNKYPQRADTTLSGTSTHLDLSGSSGNKKGNKNTVKQGDKLISSPVSEDDWNNNYKFYDRKIQQYRGKNKELLASWRQLRDQAKQTADAMAFERENGTLPQQPTPILKFSPYQREETAAGIVDTLQQQLDQAQKEVTFAPTIDAIVEAQANVSRIQAQIDEATKGKVTIPAPVEPERIETGSVADKRQSYQNAASAIERIRTDYEIGVIANKDEAEKAIKEYNDKLQALGLKPIKVKLEADTDSLENAKSSFSSVFSSIQSGWSAIEGIDTGIQSLTDAIDGNKKGWEAVKSAINGILNVISNAATLYQLLSAATATNTVATEADTIANTANAASSTKKAAADTLAASSGAAELGVTKAKTEANVGEAFSDAASTTSKATKSAASLPFPANIAAIAAAVAAGLSVVAVISSIVGMFADGGIVPGTSTSGDRLTARVNSGEMILTRQQQARLFAIANGSRPGVYMPQQRPVISSARATAPVVTAPARITLELQGRKLVGLMRNELAVSSRTT